jgi:hypothetical protein
VKPSFRCALTNILHYECHGGSILISKTKIISYFDKCLASPLSWKILHAARAVTPPLGTVDRLRVDIRREDPQTKRRESRREALSPDNREGIGLFTAGAPCTPTAYFALSTGDH